MFRKTLIATLALLIAGGTAFAGPRAIEPVAAVSAGLQVSAKTSAIRFRVSRPVMVRNLDVASGTTRQMSRERVAG